MSLNYKNYSSQLNTFNFLTKTNKNNKVSSNTYETEYEDLDYSIVENKKIVKEIKEKYKSIDYSYIENEGYTVQGITVIDNVAYITAHGKEEVEENGKKEQKSAAKLYIYDLTRDKKDAYMGKILLDQTSHVGGVTFDKINGIMYVTGGDGHYTTYDYNLLKKVIDENISQNKEIDFKLKTINNIKEKEFNEYISKIDDPVLKSYLATTSYPKKIGDDEVKSIYAEWEYYMDKFKNEDYDENVNALDELPTWVKLINSKLTKYYDVALINNINAKCTSSATYFYNNKLYVAKFGNEKKACMDILEPVIEKDEYGTEYVIYKRVIDKPMDIPTLVQGVAITEYKGEEYILFSRSLLNPNGSSITVYKKNEYGNYEDIGTYYTDDLGLEGIQINDDGEVIGVCEKYLSKKLIQEKVGNTFYLTLKNYIDSAAYIPYLNSIIEQPQETVVYTMDEILNNLEETKKENEMFNKLSYDIYENKKWKAVKSFGALMSYYNDEFHRDLNKPSKIIPTILNIYNNSQATGGILVSGFVKSKFEPFTNLISKDNTGKKFVEAYHDALDTSLVGNYAIMADEIKHNGVLGGTIKGTSKKIVNTGATVTKVGVQSLVGYAKFNAWGLSKLGFDFDLDDYDEFAEIVDETLDKAKNKANDFIDDVGDTIKDKYKKGKKAVKKYTSAFLDLF